MNARLPAAAGIWLLLLAAGIASAFGAEIPLFAPQGPVIREFRFRLTEPAMASLRSMPRGYVPAELRLDGRTALTVGLRLKGSTGSFRPLDDRPALTVDINRLVPHQRLDGHTKLHLNNSVEDPSRLSEWLGHELFGRAGLPTPQVGHARVWLNGRNLGLYVLREGFTAGFLRRAMPDRPGSLWEPLPASDVDGPFHLSARTGNAGDAEISSLAAAAREPDLRRRWDRLAERLDTERFASLLAAEVLLGHRDGYALARNNYRVFVADESGSVTFLPHGYDQLFATPDLPADPQFSGLVARAWIATGSGQRRFSDQFTALQERLLDAEDLTHRLRERAAALRPGLSAGEWAEVEAGLGDLTGRIRERATIVARQREKAAPLRLTPGESLPLTGWKAALAPDGSRLTRGPAPDRTPSWHIGIGPALAASWRLQINLAAGRYRFSGRIMTRGVTALPHGRNHGAALRPGGTDLRAGNLLGDQEWQPVAVEFETGEAAGATDLQLELRAAAGDAWFAADSLQLVRLP